jgi:hypothetical protein
LYAKQNNGIFDDIAPGNGIENQKISEKIYSGFFFLAFLTMQIRQVYKKYL